VTSSVDATSTPARGLTKGADWSTTDLLMLLMVTVWAVNYSVVKICFNYFTPLGLNALRFGLSTLVLVSFLLSRGENLRVARRDLPGFLFMGVIGHGIYQMFFINGLSRTTASNTSLLLATMPIFVALIAHVTHLERLRPLAWGGVFISFLGIVLLIGKSPDALMAGGAGLLGDLFVLVASVLWAAYSIVSKPLLARYSPIKVTALQMLIGEPVLLFFGLPSLIAQNWSSVSLGAWGGVLFSSVIATAMAYVIWSTGVKKSGNTRTAVFTYLTPVLTVVIAAITLGDRLSVLQTVGALVVLAGLILTRIGRKG
jgi:drug/metabolite transporter (DMT)-like permease